MDTHNIQMLNSVFGVVISLLSFLVSIAALVIGVLTLKTTIAISNRQRKKQDIDYLTNALVVPYNKIETDLIMLSDGRNTFLDHDKFDKEVLDGICISKSYALLIRNDELFRYLDGLITGESKENMGKFIEDYFEARDEIISQANKRIRKTDGEKMRDSFLKRCRQLRDDTILSIFKLLND